MLRKRDLHRFVNYPKIGCVEKDHHEQGHNVVKPETIEFATVDVHAEVGGKVEVYFRVYNLASGLIPGCIE